MGPLTLWYVWARAVARHDLWLSGLHVLTLVGCSILALHSFAKMRRTLRVDAAQAAVNERRQMAVWGAGVALACGLATIGTYKPVAETTSAWHRNNGVDPLQSAKDRLYAPAWAQALGYHAFSLGVRARDAKLAGLDLSSLELRLADLTNANLVGARVINSWLQGSNLSGATLSRADLTGTSFVGADFTGATFDETVLTGANFIDANGLTAAQIQAGCGTGHVQATVEGRPRGDWFKLKPCKAVAERLRREQAAAEALARVAKTKAEKQAAAAAAMAAGQALLNEIVAAKRAAAEEQARAEARTKEQAIRTKATAPRPKAGQPVVPPDFFEDEGAATAPPFDESAAASTLNAAAAAVAQTCKAGQSLTSDAIVRFVPSGHVEMVALDGRLDTSTAACVDAIFRKSTIAAFSGDAVTVTRSFSIEAASTRVLTPRPKTLPPLE